ncbi:hypothetical protein BUE64_10515 [Corynebacterium diphtheriae subsp. lausannense]|nr:hypothetical protein BUE64_10515 [Corynebacterium diphtheriae subsp. lausannense]
MTRAEVERIVAEARAENKTPNLQGANLWVTNLRFADLRGVDLQAANLRGSDLQGADLQDANLQGADLQDANLQGADLQHASLRDADLQGADLRFADLHDCTWAGLQIKQLPYNQAILTPTRKGWRIRIGCWDGTPEELKTIISKDDGWIETGGDENHLPCSYLESVLTLCEAHMKNNAKIIEDLKAKWGDA